MSPFILTIVSDHPVLQIGLSYIVKGFLDDPVIRFLNNQQITPEIILTSNLLLITTDYDDKLEILTRINLQKRNKKNIIIYDQDPRLIYVTEFSDMGVAGYISAVDSTDELLVCIKKVLMGQKYFSGSIWRYLQTRQMLEAKSNFHQMLTTREKEVMGWLHLWGQYASTTRV